MLRLRRQQWLQMVGHSLDCFPEEGCGLLGGWPGGAVEVFRPCPNADRSARTYAIDGLDILRFERELESGLEGMEILGVMHSHTHTDAYPSPTDVERAEHLGAWHFLIVSLRHPEPVARSYRILEGEITEEPIVVSLA
ncbi:MAG: M67 family metallopeptidase [Actinomycetota bacterium]|nr:M67 family metallopeptidase [Actinomycetota bacterium]